MLVEFTVGNYLSFREDMTLSLVKTRLTSAAPHLNQGAYTHGQPDLSVLHVAAIYGANGSGKSNLIRALQFMLSFIQNSSREGQSDDQINVTPFLFDDEAHKEPSYFEVVFLRRGVQYRYGFEANNTEVSREWLFRKKMRETLLFEREGQHSFELRAEFKEAELVIKRTRKEALFLSVCSQFEIEYARGLLSWLRRFTTISSNQLAPSFSASCIHSQRFSGQTSSLLRRFDLGISDFQTEVKSLDLAKFKHLPEEVLQQLAHHTVWEVTTIHPQYDQTGVKIGEQQLRLEAESAGTQKLFALAGPLVDTLENGKTLIIDEFASALHPLISQKIIALFHDAKTNLHGAQLIIATHDTNLINQSTLRRDEVWFVEKSKEGVSNLYSLASFRPRKDASLGRDYFRGKFGAIPFLGGLDLLFSHPTDSKSNP